MHSNKKLLGLVASILSLSAVACGGATGSVDPVDDNVTPPAASPSPDAGAPSSNTNNTNNNAADGGTSTTSPTSDAGTTTTTTASANCNVTVNSPMLCVEDVHGKAGDVIDLPIDYLGTTTCTSAFEASGHLVMPDFFELTNPVQQVNCVSRDNYGAPAIGTTEIMWDHFGAGSISACPNELVPGRSDVVQIEILPGAPSGDYDVTWTNPSLPAAIPACVALNSGINGHIHVD
jgi:hypothetical protein